MAARAAVQSLLVGDLEPEGKLALLGFQKAYASNSVDTPAEHKFIIVRWEETNPQFGDRGPQRMTVWAHTRDHDYSDIDSALERVKLLVTRSVHLVGGDGWVLTQADWRGDSQDLVDDGFGTLTRNSSFDVVSRYATSQI